MVNLVNGMITKSSAYSIAGHGLHVTWITSDHVTYVTSATHLCCCFALFFIRWSEKIEGARTLTL